MGTNIDDIIAGFSSERQLKIRAGAQAKIDEMIREARTLADVRNAVGKTQTTVALELGIGQNAVSQLEKRSDIYVSTLRRILKSLGLDLEMSVVNKVGTRIDLPGLFVSSVNAKGRAASSPRKKIPRVAGNAVVQKGAAVPGGAKPDPALSKARKVASRRQVVPAAKTLDVSNPPRKRPATAPKPASGVRKT